MNIKKILRIASLGSLMLMSYKNLVAQYGVPISYQNLNKIVKVVTEKNKPIKNLEVSILDRNDTISLRTDKNGIAKFKTRAGSFIHYQVKDIDGRRNKGKFVAQDSIVYFDEKEVKFIMKKKKK